MASGPTRVRAMAETELLAVPDLGTHLSLLSSDLSSTLTGFLDAHQTCAPVIGVSLYFAPRHNSTAGEPRITTWLQTIKDRDKTANDSIATRRVTRNRT